MNYTELDWRWPFLDVRGGPDTNAETFARGGALVTVFAVPDRSTHLIFARSPG